MMYSFISLPFCPDPDPDPQIYADPDPDPTRVKTCGSETLQSCWLKEKVQIGEWNEDELGSKQSKLLHATIKYCLFSKIAGWKSELDCKFVWINQKVVPVNSKKFTCNFWQAVDWDHDLQHLRRYQSHCPLYNQPVFFYRIYSRKLVKFRYLIQKL